MSYFIQFHSIPVSTSVNTSQLSYNTTLSMLIVDNYGISNWMVWEIHLHICGGRSCHLLISKAKPRKRYGSTTFRLNSVENVLSVVKQILFGMQCSISMFSLCYYRPMHSSPNSSLVLFMPEAWVTTS